MVANGQQAVALLIAAAEAQPLASEPSQTPYEAKDMVAKIIDGKAVAVT